MHKNVLLDWIAAAEERHFVENAAAQCSASGLETEMLAASNVAERSFWRRFTTWPTAAGRTAPRGTEPKTELR